VLIRVAVPVPALDLLTYLVPDGIPAPMPGARVAVPLGSRTVTGIVVETGAAEDVQGEIRHVTRVLDARAFVPPNVLDLARWTADYYAAGIGETLAAVLPPKARGTVVDAHKTRQVVSATDAGRSYLAETPHVTRTQQAALERLAGSPGATPLTTLTAEGISADTIARLVRRGLAAVEHERVDRDPFAALANVGVIDARRRLTLEQSEAFERLRSMADARVFRVALLHGVTGSGKTELYLRLAASVLSSGRTVLMLVPEIALTSAVASLFRQTFAGQVAVQHSGLSDGERHDQWHRIRSGTVGVVVGTRSAVFAPLDRVGLVVVDEEHDNAYKQEESPRYNGRDVAIVRAERAAALVVLGSATPSMESYHNTERGRYERVVLSRRVHDRPLADVTIVDMRQQYAEEGPDVILSRPLREALGLRLARSEQALILLNRRGFATSVFCRRCAGTVDCPNCSVSLVVHGEATGRRARCHYCNYTTRVPAKCPLCAAPYMEQAGFGTERVEAEVRALWANARVARLDRDAIRRKGAANTLLTRFGRGDLDVLVGTQMIAKGHDFPGVTLVGVVSADVGLGVADFRASERTFQLIAQVAGRAGRGERPGEAFVQTLYPDHYSIELACRQDYRQFYERELQYRLSMQYPPAVALINAVVRARTFGAAMDDAAGIAERLRRSGDELVVLGPAPAPLGRLRGEYRAQILIKGRNRRRMREAVKTAIAARGDLARRTTVDVDPLSMT
jgi:primosomal protein N' (replication factor Y)